MTFQGFARTNGALVVIVLPAGTSPPAGTEKFNGFARASDGSLYVVMA